MNSERIRLIYLALISGYEGKMNWYKLDRSLRGQKIGTDDLLEVLGELAQSGLITRSTTEKPGEEHYAITAQGQALLEAHKSEINGDSSK